MLNQGDTNHEVTVTAAEGRTYGGSFSKLNEDHPYTIERDYMCEGSLCCFDPV
jgi:hypothetical protein